jgi:chemotaxis protein CheC
MEPNQAQSGRALAEIADQAATCAAAAFAEILNLPVSVQLSQAELVDERGAGAAILEAGSKWGKAVHMHFDDGACGEALFLLPAGHDASLMATVFEQNPDLQDVENSAEAALFEIGNVLLNACVGTLVNRMGLRVNYLVPKVIDAPVISELISPDPDQPARFLQMLSTLGVGDIKVKAYIILIFYTDLASLVN